MDNQKILCLEKNIILTKNFVSGMFEAPPLRRPFSFSSASPPWALKLALKVFIKSA